MGGTVRWLTDPVGAYKAKGDEAKANADRQNAEMQAKATRDASERAAAAARESAVQAGQQQTANAARDAAQGAAQDILSKPMENVDVQLATSTDSAAGAARKKRASFGTGYSSGVNI